MSVIEAQFSSKELELERNQYGLLEKLESSP